MKKSSESLLERFSIALINKPKTSLAITLALVAIISFQLKNVWIDVSTEAYLPEGATAVGDLDDFK
ncbi:hypothetical protein [Thalassotalea agarivorans]|uniref:Uncharacterized protein n=1 Tax=Thalassotalea agarivorans TaxID=349064 RepID=A0A1H9Y9T4_THASX|nr:hypothetical protein [Thalassotalea agarivorans]SES65186.1 hypothetical protein SAMN05660429_00122 [Thalassotalea agarivorans]